MCIYRVTLSFWKLWFDKLSQKSKDNVALDISHLTLIFTNMLYTSCLACKNVKHQNVRHLLSQFFFKKAVSIYSITNSPLIIPVNSVKLESIWPTLLIRDLAMIISLNTLLSVATKEAWHSIVTASKYMFNSHGKGRVSNVFLYFPRVSECPKANRYSIISTLNGDDVWHLGCTLAVFFVTLTKRASSPWQWCHPWKGEPGCIKGEIEGVMGNKPVSNISPWPLLQVPALLEFLSQLPQ